MHRYRYPRAHLIVAAVALGGCTTNTIGLPDYPLGVPNHVSLKDIPAPVRPVVHPTAQPAAAVQPAATDIYRGISPSIQIVNSDDRTASRLALALFHELNVRGHINPQGNWHIVGAVEGETVRWQIIDEEHRVIAEVDQKGLTDAAVAAIVAGVMSYLKISL